MDLYTLTETFLPKEPVDEFVSAIWTERYAAAGDFQLVVPVSEQNLVRFGEGTRMALVGSDEVMTIDTQSIDSGVMTVVGSGLELFLNQRVLWAKNPDSSAAEDRIKDYSDDTRKPGEFVSDLVYKFAIFPTDFTGLWIPANLDNVKEAIAHLSLGAVDTSGTAVRLTAPIGPLYDAVQQVANATGVGFKLYLESADPLTGYSLKFKTYRGLDRTSNQSTNELVRLSPDLDSIQNLKEVRSNKDFKNVCYVYYKGVVTKHLLDPSADEPEGFDRRVILTNAEGEPVGHKVYNAPTQGMYPFFRSAPYDPSYWVTEVSPGEETAFRAQNAADAFANHNYIHAVDGETSPISEYQYGTHYGLGDLIELEGLTGALSSARVTEFIRSQDGNGERAYPTISVVGAA